MGSGSNILLKACSLIIPFLIGLSISDKVLPRNDNVNYNDATNLYNPSKSKVKTTTVHRNSGADVWHNVKLAVHRNGEPEPCGYTTKSLTDVMPSRTDSLSQKYEFESFLTYSLGKDALDKDACGLEQPPASIKGKKRKTWGRGEDYSIPGIDSSFLTFCDMGPERTTILPDHNELVRVQTGSVTTLPCHFHTREGLRFTSYKELLDYVHKIVHMAGIPADAGEEECVISDDGSTLCAPRQSPDAMDVDVHIYAVPAGRSFMFAPSYIGEVFHIDHVESGHHPISLEVMSLSPRVFDIINFFDKAESAAIVDKAIHETSETHRIKRSSTGASGYNLNNQRTSENGFDTHGKTAMVVKKRCMKVLGHDTYIESFTDGLQVLRYNKTTAYIPHMDYIDDPQKREVHDFDASRLGTNRFATILLYMSDLKGESDGGETVFKNAWPVGLPEEDRKTRSQALAELRGAGDADFLKKGSWEEFMVADCRARLAVKPHSARAVLFYSQHPNGEEDTSSLHGGCPVLKGEKWAANLWVWNGPRGGFPGSPKNKGKEKVEAEVVGQIQAQFINTGKDPVFAKAQLYFEETFWGEFSHGDPKLNINTFAGHKWNIKRIPDGKLLKTIVVEGGQKTVRYLV